MPRAGEGEQTLTAHAWAKTFVWGSLCFPSGAVSVPSEGKNEESQKNPIPGSKEDKGKTRGAGCVLTALLTRLCTNKLAAKSRARADKCSQIALRSSAAGAVREPNVLKLRDEH